MTNEQQKTTEQTTTTTTEQKTKNKKRIELLVEVIGFCVVTTIIVIAMSLSIQKKNTRITELSDHLTEQTAILKNQVNMTTKLDGENKELTDIVIKSRDVIKRFNSLAILKMTPKEYTRGYLLNTKVPVKVNPRLFLAALSLSGDTLKVPTNLHATWELQQLTSGKQEPYLSWLFNTVLYESCALAHKNAGDPLTGATGLPMIFKLYYMSNTKNMELTEADALKADALLLNYEALYRANKIEPFFIMN